MTPAHINTIQAERVRGRHAFCRGDALFRYRSSRPSCHLWGIGEATIHRDSGGRGGGGGGGGVESRVEAAHEAVPQGRGGIPRIPPIWLGTSNR